MVVAANGSPATAAGDPVPKVRIGALSGPVPSPGGGEDYLLDVRARDRDGIITGVTVEYTSGGLTSVTTADRPCFLFPSEPGERVRMTIPLTFPGPGAYRVEVRAHSLPECGTDVGAQTSRTASRRFVVRS